MARARKRFRQRQRRWLLTIIVVLVVSGVGWWSWDQQGPGRQTRVQAAAGKRAPAFTLPSATGDSVALESYLGHQPVVLVFYMGDF
jgi:lipopolysaccharide export system protein LptC